MSAINKRIVHYYSHTGWGAVYQNLSVSHIMSIFVGCLHKCCMQPTFYYERALTSVVCDCCCHSD